MKAAETTKGWPLSPDSMEAILPTKKMAVEAELVSSEAGRGYKKAKEVPEIAGVTEEVGMALEVLVIRTSKANQTNNRIQTSTMTSKLLNKLSIYLIKIFGCWEAIRNKLLMASLESDSRGLSSKVRFDKIRFHEIP